MCILPSDDGPEAVSASGHGIPDPELTIKTRAYQQATIHTQAVNVLQIVHVHDYQQNYIYIYVQ